VYVLTPALAQSGLLLRNQSSGHDSFDQIRQKADTRHRHENLQINVAFSVILACPQMSELTYLLTEDHENDIGLLLLRMLLYQVLRVSD